MRREEKNAIIDSLAERLKEYSHFYLTDTAQLNAADTSDLRRKCFENNIKLVVVKNTLLKRALEQSNGNFDELYPLSLIHISEPTRRTPISYAVFCLKKKI